MKCVFRISLYKFCLLDFILPFLLFFDWPITPTAFNVQSPLHKIGKPTLPSHVFDHVRHFVQFAKFATHTQFCKVLRFTHTSQYFEVVAVWKR